MIVHCGGWRFAAAECGYDYLCDLATHKCYPPKDCFAAIKVWRGGLAYYGGFIFAVAFAFHFVRKHKTAVGIHEHQGVRKLWPAFAFRDRGRHQKDIHFNGNPRLRKTAHSILWSISPRSTTM